MSKNCVSCGKEIDDDAKVCELCSAVQNEEDTEDIKSAEITDEDTEVEETETEEAEAEEEKKSSAKRPLAKKRAIIIGIPAVLIAAALTVAICLLVGSSYQSAVRRYFKGIYRNKPSSYISAVSAMKYYGNDAEEFYEKKKLYVQNELLTLTEPYTEEIGKIKKVDVKFGKKQKKDTDYVEGLFLLSGAEYNKEGIKAEDITKPYTINLTLTLTGKGGMKILEVTDLFICKEKGEWKVYKSFDTDISQYGLIEES